MKFYHIAGTNKIQYVSPVVLQLLERIHALSGAVVTVVSVAVSKGSHATELAS